MPKSENNKTLKKVAIFASGRGSNARAILDYLKDDPTIKVVLIVSNDPEAGVLELARERKIESMVISRKSMNTSDILDVKMADLEIDMIVLAGFLLLIPKRLIHQYPNKIINIHPALLPKYGGKGMYGHHVHEAVYVAQDDKSGITIHYVNENYDEGQHILQESCKLEPGDSPDTIAAKVLKLEHHFFPRVIKDLLNYE